MFDSFLKSIGIPEDRFNTVIGALGFLLAVATVLLPPVRRLLSWAFYKSLGVLGFTSWVYRKRFLDRYSVVHNIYLDKEEKLDLRATYVPLHVDRPGQAGRASAAELLSDPDEKRLIVVGDAGTGKTTLIKAFGTGTIRPFSGIRTHGLQKRKSSCETPIIVDLRHFAAKEFDEHTLADYIVEYVLRRQMKLKNAADFFRSLLRKQRCLVLLDGLDEVSDYDYEHVRTRISAFCTCTETEMQTESARIVVTCRKQNFERVRSDWVPTPFSTIVTLVPFDMDEVYHFLSRREPDFSSPRSPNAFFQQIKASGMASMHRNPLILTISLGLYLNTPKYEIPGSIAQFYETMVDHLLRRHDFRSDSRVKSVNEYRAEDKTRFLREFALKMATRESGFDEFSSREISNMFVAIHEDMTNVDEKDEDKFIREIVFHSGLLARVSDDDVYIFAHRSIHEYFIAVQLARNPAEGTLTLLEKAGNSRWRQVIVFFAALDHEQVEPFLNGLMEQHLELAGHCAPVARVMPTALAERMADALARDIHEQNAANSLPALISMTTSQRDAVRKVAMNRLQQVLKTVFATESYQLVGLEDEDVSGLLAH